MSKRASDALETLRRAGMKINPQVAQAVDRMRETMRDEDPVVEDEVSMPPIHYGYEEFPVRSIKVLEMNFGHVKLELIDIEKNEEEIESTIRMLVEAICMLREEVTEIRHERMAKYENPF